MPLIIKTFIFWFIMDNIFSQMESKNADEHIQQKQSYTSTVNCANFAKINATTLEHSESGLTNISKKTEPRKNKLDWNISTIFGHRQRRGAEESGLNYTTQCGLLTLTNLTENSDMFHIYSVHYYFCPDIPLCENENNHKDWFSSCCENCSCSNDCRMYKNCCPDTPGVDFKPYNEDNGLLCTKSAYNTEDPDNEIESYWMISVCSTKNSNNTLEALCRDDNIGSSLIKKLPVSSKDGRIAYRNSFCALCNNVTDYNYWTGKIICSDGTPFISTTMKEVEKELMQKDRCNMKFIPPQNAKAVPCTQRNVISTCNVTGLWQKRNDFIEKACLSYTSVYTLNQIHFQNVFCWMCNVAKMANGSQMECDICKRYGLWLKNKLLGLSFSALLDFHETLEDKSTISHSKHCQKNQIFDGYTDTCLNVGCLWPLAYVNVTCVMKYKEIKGLVLSLFIRVKADNITENCYGCCSLKTGKTMSQLSKLIENEMEENVKFMIKSRAAYIKNNNRFNVLEEHLFEIEEFLFTYKILLPEGLNLYQNVVSQLLQLDFKDLTFSTKKNTSFKLIIDGQTNFSINVRNFSMLLDPTDGYVFFQCFDIDDMILSNYNSHSVMQLSDLLICPYVNITKDMWPLTRVETQICINEVNFCLNPSQYKEHIDRIMICKERYDHIMTLYLNIKDGPNPSKIENILSIICMATSIVSLFITCFTYSMFKVLRTLPGLNIMALSVSMLVAFCLLFVGQADVKPAALCSTIGLLTHVSWLSTFSWMNVCCIHIFRTFCNLQMKTSRVCRPFSFYILYTLFISAIFVSINITREIGSGAKTFGYDSKTCYISKNENILLTVALPLALIIVINTSLFIVVLVRIARMPSIQKNARHHRNNLLIFVKLSSFTGVTWIFGYIYSFTRYIVFSYLFIIFGALQGLFIALAFIVNKRVFMLYRTLCCKRKKESTQSFQMSSGVHTTSSQYETRY